MSLQTEKQKKSGLRCAGVVLLALFAFPMVLTALIPIVGQRDESVQENRTLKKLPAWTAQGFLSGAFQDDLEDALIDQLPLGEPVKGAVLDAKNGLLKTQQQLLFALRPDLKSNYSLIADGYYHYAGDAHRIVEKPKAYDAAHLEALAASFRGLPDVKIYFIENSRTVDFDHPAEENEALRQTLAAFAPAAWDVFPVEDYESYCRNFYQTDHHWNCEGSYEGYRAVYRLLHGTEEGMIPAGDTVGTDAVFQGSYARQTHDLCADETFAFKTFDLPKFTTEINGRRRAYGNTAMYARGKYPTDSLANHYANCFGGDFGQIVYDFGTEGKGKLLLVASSYSNPINALIAAGYDQTYVVDLRYYQEWAGKPFDPVSYCEENGIGTVLLLGDVNLFFVDGPEEGGE